MRVSTVETWLGPFTVVVDGDGAVLASGWTAEPGTLLPLIHRSLRAGEPRANRDLGAVTRAVRAYHDGDLGAVDGQVVRQHNGGAFLTAAWKVLREVTPGSPITYTEFAGRTDEFLARPVRSSLADARCDAPRRPRSPSASRAAAQACARNAAALFVPCHRIVRADGSVGGFRWGPETKRRLLAHESPEA